MLQKNSDLHHDQEESFGVREALYSLGLAVCCVAAGYGVVCLLLLPVVRV